MTESRSERLHARALRVMPGGNTRTTLAIEPYPPYVQRGEGYEIVDVDGHRAIDLVANYTALVHGHAHPAIVAAAAETIAEGASFGLPTAAGVELAERLCARIPALEQVRFANSGTEAVMMAVRTARAFTGRDAVLRFAGAYHGTYDAALAEGAPGLSSGPRGELVTVAVDDVAGFGRAVEEHGERLACVLLDLMPNRAGLRPMAAELVERVRAETAARGILLIADEIITFRLATAGLHAAYGLQPDLVTLGKIIGGGFPVGAFGGRADVMAVFDPRGPAPVGHGGTFTANPVTMRAGAVSIDLLDAAAIARINGLGDAVRARIGALGLAVSGSGSLFRLLDVHGDPARWWSLYRAGLLVGGNGLCSISTVMDEAVADEVVERFARVADASSAPVAKHA